MDPRKAQRPSASASPTTTPWSGWASAACSATRDDIVVAARPGTARRRSPWPDGQAGRDAPRRPDAPPGRGQCGPRGGPARHGADADVLGLGRGRLRGRQGGALGYLVHGNFTENELLSAVRMAARGFGTFSAQAVAALSNPSRQVRPAPRTGCRSARPSDGADRQGAANSDIARACSSRRRRSRTTSTTSSPSSANNRGHAVALWLAHHGPRPCAVRARLPRSLPVYRPGIGERTRQTRSISPPA